MTMPDELAELHREYGKPPTHHVYAQSEDGAIREETYAQMESLSDFEAGSFYVQPKEKPKLKTTYRKRDICADAPRKKKGKLESWRK